MPFRRLNIHVTDNESVADQRPIPTPDNEQMELLTQLRRGRTIRAPVIRRALREATRAVVWLDTLIETMGSRHEPNPDMLVIPQLQHLARLLRRLIALVEGEARELEIEHDLWLQIAY
ncbi:hypothetical protein N7536_012102 [Penicillium majusculum]|nr:hypothetical protein N7536_012102 [Penicillium majusculum]